MKEVSKPGGDDSEAASAPSPDTSSAANLPSSGGGSSWGDPPSSGGGSSRKGCAVPLAGPQSSVPQPEEGAASTRGRDGGGGGGGGGDGDGDGDGSASSDGAASSNGAASSDGSAPSPDVESAVDPPSAGDGRSSLSPTLYGPFPGEVVEIIASRRNRGEERRGLTDEQIRDIIIEQSPSVEGVAVPDETPGEGRGGRADCGNRRCVFAAAALSVVAFAAATINLVLVLRSSAQREGGVDVPVDPSHQWDGFRPLRPSKRLAAITSALESATSKEALEDPATPQHRALVWIADEDVRRVDWRDAQGLRQRFALTTLFFATGGEESWIHRCNFLSGEHECHWNESVPEYGKYGNKYDLHESVPEYGDTMDSIPFPYKGAFCYGSSTTVSHIIIPKNNVTGQLSKEITLLSGLRVLSLSGNVLTGPVPWSFLDKLRNLKKLSLYDNSFTGTIPDSIGNLSKLTLMDLGSNRLSGTIPSSINRLENCKRFDVEANLLNGTLPIQHGGLPALERLILWENMFSGTIPPSLGTLPKLRFLMLTSNLFEETIPKELSALPKLEVLGLYKNLLSGTVPDFIGDMLAMEAVGFGHNFLEGTIPDNIANPLNMIAISLEANRLVGTIPPSIGDLQNLSAVVLHSNLLTGTIPASFGNATYLRALELANNRLEGTVPRTLQNLKHLLWLSLKRNNLSGDMNFICGASSAFLQADCDGGENGDAEVDCSCCSICCRDDYDVSRCSSNYLQIDALVKKCGDDMSCYDPQ